jgi:hypothetical protein
LQRNIHATFATLSAEQLHEIDHVFEKAATLTGTREFSWEVNFLKSRYGAVHDYIMEHHPSTWAVSQMLISSCWMNKYNLEYKFNSTFAAEKVEMSPMRLVQAIMDHVAKL